MNYTKTSNEAQSLYNKKKILIVDDSVLFLKIVERILKKQNYELLFAKDAGEALDIIENVTPDVILLDIILPNLDGYNMLKLLKLRSQTQNVPVIFVSSLDRGMDISKGLKLGAYDYIIKPFTANELNNKINRALLDCDPFKI